MSHPDAHKYENGKSSALLGYYVNALLSRLETHYVLGDFFHIGAISNIDHLIDVVVWFSDEYQVTLLGHLSLPLEVKELFRRQGLRPVGILSDSYAKKLRKHVTHVSTDAEAVGASFQISPDNVRSVGKLLREILNVFERDRRPNHELHLFAETWQPEQASEDAGR